MEREELKKKKAMMYHFPFFCDRWTKLQVWKHPELPHLPNLDRKLRHVELETDRFSLFNMPLLLR